MTTIKWTNVEIGKKYKYEERHNLQAEVLILYKDLFNDFIRIKIKIILSVYNCKKDNIFFVGKYLDKKFSHIMDGHNFKTLDDKFDYIITKDFLP